MPRTLPPGEASFNKLVWNWMRNAKKRKLEWVLTLGDVKVLSKSLCYYCGAEPSMTLNQATYNGDYIYNGIDRIDPSKGYVLGNVVPSCKTCNRSKRAMNQTEFIEWIDRVHYNVPRE